MYSMKNSQCTMISIRLCSARARCMRHGARARRERAARCAEGLMMALLLPERMLGGYDGDPDGINGA